MKYTLPILFSLVLITASVAAGQQDAGKTARVRGTLEGPREAVFRSPEDSCNSNDLPDAMARAFRDYTGTVHLVAASSELFESVGPSLDSVKHSCEVGHRSVEDPNPADFNDQVWIDSFYTFDGKTIAGLAHTEYHGWLHPHECKTQNFSECEYDADTYHLSNDGGYHFNSYKGPDNFLAGVPYQYQVDRGPSGYSVDSNIIELGGWFYAMVTSYSWPPNCSTQGPPRCRTPSGGGPIRTQDIFDPSSWRGWSGKDFSISFVDPYPNLVKSPQLHTYTPVQYMDVVTAVNIFRSSGLVIATLWNPWTTEYGERGLYLSTSTDMVNWTKPTLVATLDQFLDQEPIGIWSYAYFTLIDPDAPDLNFSVVGDHPYLYYVRLNNQNSGYRVLFRQRIDLSLIQ